MNNCLGTHVLIDFINIYGEEKELGDFVFDLMIKVLQQTTMKIVHKQLVILNGDGVDPGSTSALLLLDSSHFTSHIYSARGLLSCDLYTCGQTDTIKCIDFFQEELKKKYPDMKTSFFQNHKRFIYN